MKVAMRLLAAVLLPYTLNITGQSPFYAKAGVPSCLAAARDELDRQKKVVARACARDGGELRQGEVQETLVQGVQCEAVLPMTCALRGRSGAPTSPLETAAAPRS